MLAAASSRAAGVKQRADRPSQRRDGEGSKTARVTARLEGGQIREAGDGSGRLVFEGVASATDRGYEMWDFFGPYTEIMQGGAFDVTLAQTDPALDVPLVLGHDQMRRVARTTSAVSPLALSKTKEGLRVLAPSLDPADPDVDYARRKMDAGLLDEMSFAFRIIKGWWSDDFETYLIEEVDIHRGDVSLVGFGANPHTWGTLKASADAERAAASELAIQRARLDLALASVVR